jgi:hypothetical protein
MVGVVLREDHLKKPLSDEQVYLLKLLGTKAERLLAHIRAGGEPPRHRPKPIRYDEPKPRGH